MTCASCVARNEKALRKLEGVDEANVNFATEKATVAFDPAVLSASELVARVEAAGYGVVTAQETLPILGHDLRELRRRVERALRKPPGVLNADVNLATEKATVTYVPGQADRDDLVAAVEAAGYDVVERRPPARPARGDGVGASTSPRRRAPRRTARLKLKVSSASSSASSSSSAPCSRTGSPSCPTWLHNGYVLWALATPVQFWVGWQFYTTAWAALRHGTHDDEHADRHGLVGGLLLQRARRALPGASSSTRASSMPMYFDSAALIITLILFGRLLEARAKGADRRRHQGADRPAAAHGARAARRRRDRRAGRRASSPATLVVVRPGEKVPVDGVVVEGSLGGGRVDAHRRADAGRARAPATR